MDAVSPGGDEDRRGKRRRRRAERQQRGLIAGGGKGRRAGNRRSDGISQQDVVALYRFLLNREPNEQEMRDRLADREFDVARAKIIATQEFASQTSRWRVDHPLIVFLHVQKTGGRSFSAVAKQAYGEALYWYNKRIGRSIREEVKAKPESLCYAPLVGGHFVKTPALFDSLERPVIYLATMRDSVARAISLYNFVRSRAHHALHDEIAHLSLYESLTTVKRFRRAACGNQLRAIFGEQGMTSADERQRILRTERYVIGKLEHFSRFISYVGANVIGRTDLEIPHENSGSSSSREEVKKQPDFDRALALLQTENAEEAEFYSSFDEIFVSEPMQRNLRNPLL
jgi:hypothetical protein